MLATSVVVAAAVGTATWFSTASINELAELQIDERRAGDERAITRESELVATSLANAAALPVSTFSRTDVEAQLDRTIAEDIADLERERAAHGTTSTAAPERIQWLVVTLPCPHGSSGCQIGPQVAWSDAATMRRRKANQLVASPPSTLPDAADLAIVKASLARGAKNGRVSHARTGADWVYGTPIEYGTDVRGELWMGVTTKQLEDRLAESLAVATARAHATRNRMLLVSLFVFVIGVLLAALQGVQLARPIKALTVRAERIGGGDLTVRAPENRRDELGVLARTFDTMASQIRGLLTQQADKVSLEKEMELARQVQQAMLPPDVLDAHGALRIVGYCMPASSCGGDWWTYRKLANGRMLLVVGDATGHGIHSAMIAATARGAVEALASIDERLLTPEQVLRAIDSAIRQVGDHNVLMTAFAAVFSEATLHYANAGQNFPYVITRDRETRVLGSARIIAASGNPLGDRNIPVEIGRGSLELHPGDLFVCFTDGVVERANRVGKLFGDRRLRGAIIGESLPDGDALTRLRDRVVGMLDRYGDGALAEDDITLVLCHFDPPVSAVARGAA